MRTNIVLNEALVTEARALSNIHTKRELIEEALKEFIASRKRLDLRDLRGCQEIHADYDYKQARSGKAAASTHNTVKNSTTKKSRAASKRT
jgi:Arc/MetJ family transcription regulator